MPELVLALIIIVLALLGVVAMSGGETIGPRPARPDPLEESAAAQRAAITAADTARASAHAAHVAELAEFDREARRILDALDVPCVCSQVLVYEWDGHTNSSRRRWTVPRHFKACDKYWPATTGTPPRGAAGQQRQGGPALTPAATREHPTTTTGVPDDCTCVPDHARALLARAAMTGTRVVHLPTCATTRGPHAAEWRPMGDNG